MLKVPATILALLVAGCSVPVAPAEVLPAPAPAPAVATAELPPTSYSIAIDPALSAADLSGVVAALGAWEAAAPVHFDTQIGPCDGADTCLAYGPPSYTLTPVTYVDTGLPSGTYTVKFDGPAGWCSFDRFGWGGRIDLDVTTEAVGVAGVTEVVEHELGHAMGLVHRAGENVMGATMQSGVSLSADDVAQWVEVHTHGSAADVAPQA